jgi:hypothetical protein
MFKLSMLRVNVTQAQDRLVKYVNSAARVSLYATESFRTMSRR